MEHQIDPPIRTQAASPLTNECAPMPDEFVGETVAKEYAVLYRSGQWGSLWECRVTAANVADADLAVTYFARLRHEDREIHIIAVIDMASVR